MELHDQASAYRQIVAVIVRGFLSAGRAAKMGLPLAAAAHQQFISASGLGHGLRDDSQVIRVYRTLARKDEA